MLNGLDKNIIKLIQEDLPLVEEPFKLIAKELGITENELLIELQELCNSGIIRRFGVTLNHRNIGFKENAMVVWNIPDDKIKEASKSMISFSQVSHCYQRPVLKNWPYNIFTMIHGETKSECEKVVKAISDAINISDYNILYSTQELKKSSMKYFMEE